jgi:FAD/FMN-containing dehydrogenase
VSEVGSGEIDDRLQAVLTNGSLSRSPAQIAASRVENPLLDSPAEPSCVLCPADADELQQLMRLANELRLNLTVTSSTGRHCRGGFAAARHNLRVDLSSWKGIPWINRRNRVCLIEPGVTYGELLPRLEAEGMTAPMPLAPRSGKSVLASVLDREPSTWPNRQWDGGDPLASTEFIFGSGEHFRTGAAGGPGTLEAQRAAGGAYKSSAGPSQTDFHRVVQGSQGTMGVVTWIALRAELRPQIERPFLLGANSLSDLVPYVYEVQRPWLGEHSFILDRTAAALLLGAGGDGSFTALRDSLPAYVCLQNVAGFERLPEERVAYQTRDIEKIARKNGLDPLPALGRVSAGRLLEAAATPGAEIEWRHHYSGHCLSIFFLTTLDRAPGLVGLFADLASGEGLGEERIGCYVQPVVQNHACHLELLAPFDPEQPAEVDRMRKLERDAVAKLAAAGAFFSRPYGSAAPAAFQRNRASYEVLKKVKRIFDPNRILNDGKWGL